MMNHVMEPIKIEISTVARAVRSLRLTLARLSDMPRMKSDPLALPTANNLPCS